MFLYRMHWEGVAPGPGLHAGGETLVPELQSPDVVFSVFVVFSMTAFCISLTVPPCGPKPPALVWPWCLDFFFFFLFWLYPWHMEVPRPGIESKQQLQST